MRPQLLTKIHSHKIQNQSDIIYRTPHKNDAVKVKALATIVKCLSETGVVPANYKPHPLHGNYEGCMECHILNDFLLIWIDEVNDIIKLVRLGSHSELF